MAKPLHAEFNSIKDLSKALHNAQISAHELATSALENLSAQKNLNAFVHIDPELTLQQAKHADTLLSKGSGTILTGIPIAHKDLLVTKGWRTTAASKMLANYTSPFNATVVQQLQDCGAVSLGKLNCDEFGMGSGNENSIFGPVKNPWNHNVIPGGSSGGSAAAVAAGLVLAATATDTGGSIRQPAAMCGVSGIKPTYGTVSRYGLIACGSSLDQAGPIARSAIDLLEILDPISGFDTNDPTSIQTCNDQPNKTGRVKAAFNRAIEQQNTNQSLPLKGLRIGIPEEYFSNSITPEVASAIENAIKEFENLGAERVSISLPHTELAIPAYYAICTAESSTNLSRFDGVNFGHRAAEYTDLNSMISKSRSEGFGSEVQRRIILGTHILSHGQYEAYYLQAQRVRRLISTDFHNALNGQCDVIMGPVALDVARPLGTTMTPTDNWRTDIYTVGASLAGLPAMSIPCGFASNLDLPVGLQIIGNYFTEGQLLATAHSYQMVTNWHQRKPEQQ